MFAVFLFYEICLLGFCDLGYIYHLFSEFCHCFISYDQSNFRPQRQYLPQNSWKDKNVKSFLVYFILKNYRVKGLMETGGGWKNLRNIAKKAIIILKNTSFCKWCLWPSWSHFFLYFIPFLLVFCLCFWICILGLWNAD